MVDKKIGAEKEIALGTDSVIVVGTEWMVAAGSGHFPPLLKALSQGQPLENKNNKWKLEIASNAWLNLV